MIVGAGLAGLFAALQLNESCNWPIILLSPAKLGNLNASCWAQGGIAAAVDSDDSARSHMEDTLNAGAGLSEPNVAQAICQAAAMHITKLGNYGVAFDRNSTQPNSPYALSLEAGHSAKRIVRCTRDGSGRTIMESLIAAIQKRPQITVIEGAEAYQLLEVNGRVCGVAYRQSEQNFYYQLWADAVILACGGASALFKATTNPISSLGQGLGMAALAGAVLSDSEFIQFHPTVLDVAETPQILISEALRGEGAILLDGKGQRFLLDTPEAKGAAELAPRDVVARAVFRAHQKTGSVFLDCRHLYPSEIEFSKHFPTLWQNTQRHGLNPTRDLLPVIPAAHYHMGGIATDLYGRSSVPGLWAIGEVACTGLHGANRLASNSLLEAVVMASQAAKDISSHIQSGHLTSLFYQIKSKTMKEETLNNFEADRLLQAFSFQELMTQYVGVERNTEKLLYALQQLSIQPKSNALIAAICITCSALLRLESRGSHYYIEDSKISNSISHESELGDVLNQYNNNGKRSFLSWKKICEIVEKICQK